ncbi:hypothetical protein O0L34_g49 [Tuta absoluta]|nr:hypothetical protein O0L34_g49 [Tuta absoluta]
MSAAGGVAGGAGAAVRSGHLRKLKTMKKKFFVLRADTPDCSARLEYYESEKKYKSGAVPRRVIPLRSCYNITRRLDLKQKHVIALFTKEEQFCVVAENEADLHGWLAAILKQHQGDDASEELLHPIQHVWQVNVQKKGLGASKNIQGLYNLCLTDKTITLVKIKSHNNVISDLGIPERVEYSLKNIRRCGDSECFFYMEVGRQTATGAGELWMHTDDSNIAQSMHSTIYLAMRNCAKETENERDHIVIPKRSDSESTVAQRRSTYSADTRRAGNASSCYGACIKQCVCAGDGTISTIDPDSSGATLVPLATKNAENQPPNNSLTEHKENPPRIIKHHRTISLPTGCPLFQEPLKIVHERTRSAPLTGDEVDRAILEKAAIHSSCKTVNGTEVLTKKAQWSRRASTGTRLSKLSPAHSKNAGTLRNRCDSMPSRPSSSFEVERPPQRLADLDGMEVSRDESDSADWHRTPRIPEEPDLCDTAIREMAAIMSTSLRSSTHQHSRTSSIGLDDPPEPLPIPDGYVPMAPHALHDPLPTGLVSASSGSVCSGTPSTDPRFSEYQLEPATSHIVECERPPRAYSVGSRPAPRPDPPRHRAYSVGARSRPPPRHPPHGVCSAPQLPRASAEDLMELDFSNNSPTTKMVVSQTPPGVGLVARDNRSLDEYVDMSPRNAGYVEMRPGDKLRPATPPQHTQHPHAPHRQRGDTQPSTPDGKYTAYILVTAAPNGCAPGTSCAPPPPRNTPPQPPHRQRGHTQPSTPDGKYTAYILVTAAPNGCAPGTSCAPPPPRNHPTPRTGRGGTHSPAHRMVSILLIISWSRQHQVDTPRGQAAPRHPPATHATPPRPAQAEGGHTAQHTGW